MPPLSLIKVTMFSVLANPTIQTIAEAGVDIILLFRFNHLSEFPDLRFHLSYRCKLWSKVF